MAKKQERVADAAAAALGDSPIRRTEPEPVPEGQEELPQMPPKAVWTPPRFSVGGKDNKIQNAGVGLRQREIEALDVIADRWGVGRNFVTRWLVILGLQTYHAGELREPPRRLP